MKTMLRRQNAVPAPTSAMIDKPTTVRQAPLAIARGEGEDVALLKVDLAACVDGMLVVSGWAIDVPALRLAIAGQSLDAERIEFDRPDVATHLGRDGAERLGFALVAPAPDGSGGSLEIQWRHADGKWQGAALALDAIEGNGTAVVLPNEVQARLMGSRLPFTVEWQRAVRAIEACSAASKSAFGYVEAAASVRDTGHVVVAGWCAAEPGAVLWVEDDHGGMHDLARADLRMRPDVFEAVGDQIGFAALNSGFVLYFEAPAEVSRVALKALTREGVHTLGEVACHRLAAQPAAVARWLFGIPVADSGIRSRYERVSGPLLNRLIEDAQAAWPALPVQSRQLGTAPARPVVSIVVPLYGRYDFVESQMLEWARDPWIRAHAELIYVIDDPALLEPFRAHAEELHRLYRIPFRWVWGMLNRGFSGANNLGAANSTGEYLLFLNSDVFPQEPGWAERMLEALAAAPSIGVVAPRLTFADGGIQHAGMRFERLGEYDVWVNRHPNMGLDPSLDPSDGLVCMPAVTGACMMLRRQDFDAVGGWDSGYLVGDFEDSDLCLKLRAAGKRVGYLPTVQLTHLERQSFKALGSGEFRQRITLFNAMRHQARWHELIEQPVEAQ